MSIETPITAASNFFIGEDKTLSFTVYDPDATADQIAALTATPQDVTGWTLAFNLRRDPESVDLTLQKTTDDDVVIIDAVGGQVDVYMHAADTSSLSPGVYFYTLRREDTDHHNDLAFGDFVLRLGAAR